MFSPSCASNLEHQLSNLICHSHRCFIWIEFRILKLFKFERGLQHFEIHEPQTGSNRFINKMSSPAPKSPEQTPTEKSKKYDRQLRLWGDHGQKLLENAKVCLINATALGTEILKSLVLPGIGSFTIVDGEKVTEEDIGSNFFLESDSTGLSRAQVATQCLLELNPDVRGDYIDESPDHIMAHTQDFFDTFSVVIATSLPEKTLVSLSQHLWEKNVPLIVCRSVGFLGYMRQQVKEHTVIEGHPDNVNPDLRLDKPWPALKEHLDKTDIASLDRKERSHVPAITILYYYLQKFKKTHGKLPTTRSEKEEIKRMILDSPLPDEHGNKILEENFKEAIRYINTCFNPNKIPAHVRAILNDESCINLNQNSSAFWIMCAALKEQVESEEGTLPVRGSLPDMAADTNSYITLQHLYQKQSQAQAESVYRRAAQIARNLGLPQDVISESEVKVFCKHASELHVIRGTCIADEYKKNRLDLASCLEDPDSLMFYYITLRGLEHFISEFNTYPGQLDDHVEPDVLKLKNIIQKLLSEWGCPPQIIIRDERVHEVCRYGGAELHSVSAILGGCVAHEAIKLITHQYKPMNNTFIYDAITSTSATYTL